MNKNASCLQKCLEAVLQTAGLGVDDVDVAFLYDCFTITVLLELEGLGFVPKGEGGPWDSQIVLEPYAQVFGDKHGYIGNLSILDLLFHKGPEAMAYLQSIQAG